MISRHDINDKEWDLIKDIIAGKEGDAGTSGVDNRRFINAVLYVCKTAISWRDLPESYGKWHSVWKRFRRCSINGTWNKINERIGENYETDKTIAIDSTSIKIHQDGTGYLKKTKNIKKR